MNLLVGKGKSMMGIVNPYRNLLNVERTFVTLLGHAAAVTLVTTVRIFSGQSKGRRTTSVAFRSLDVPLALAATAETRSATRSSFVAGALHGIGSARTIVGGATSRVSFVSGFASFAVFPGSVIGTILRKVRSESSVHQIDAERDTTRSINVFHLPRTVRSRDRTDSSARCNYKARKFQDTGLPWPSYIQRRSPRTRVPCIRRDNRIPRLRPPLPFQCYAFPPYRGKPRRA